MSSVYIDPLYHNSRPETIDPSGVWKERTKGSAARDTCLLCLRNSGLQSCPEIGFRLRRILGSYFRNSPCPFSSSGVLCIVHDNQFSLLNAK